MLHIYPKGARASGQEWMDGHFSSGFSGTEENPSITATVMLLKQQITLPQHHHV